MDATEDAWLIDRSTCAGSKVAFLERSIETVDHCAVFGGGPLFFVLKNTPPSSTATHTATSTHSGAQQQRPAMVFTKLRPYEVWEEPTGHQKFTRRIHELLPLGLQHALRDRYLGSVFDGGVKASALLIGLRYPRAVLKCVVVQMRVLLTNNDT